METPTSLPRGLVNDDDDDDDDEPFCVQMFGRQKRKTDSCHAVCHIYTSAVPRSSTGSLEQHVGTVPKSARWTWGKSMGSKCLKDHPT